MGVCRNKLTAGYESVVVDEDKIDDGTYGMNTHAHTQKRDSSEGDHMLQSCLSFCLCVLNEQIALTFGVW